MSYWLQQVTISKAQGLQALSNKVFCARGLSLSLLSDEGLGTLQVKRMIAEVAGGK